MQNRSILFRRQALALCTVGVCLFSSAVLAAGNNTITANSSKAEIEAQYKTDVNNCKSGNTNQDRATCMREAGAAREEALRNRLANGNASYQQNAVDRCNKLPETDRQDCMTQMSDQNTVTKGSVLGGGVLRETTITVPAQ